MPAAALVVGIVRDGACQIAQGQMDVRALDAVLLVATSESARGVRGEPAAALCPYAQLLISCTAVAPRRVHPPFGGVLTYPIAYGELEGTVP